MPDPRGDDIGLGYHPGQGPPGSGRFLLAPRAPVPWALDQTRLSTVLREDYSLRTDQWRSIPRDVARENPTYDDDWTLRIRVEQLGRY